MDPQNTYHTRLQELEKHQKDLLRKKSAFGMLRFGTIALIIAALYILSSLGWIYFIIVVSILLFIFVRLVLNDLENKAAIAHTGHLISINKDEISALSGHYFQFEDGKELLPLNHPYAEDIDIFGHASLFQFLNRTTSDMGSKQLAQWLLHPATAEEIIERQSAIKEISNKFHWLQTLEAYGRAKHITNTTFNKLMAWVKEPTIFLQFKHWQWLRIVLPAIILSVIAGTIAGIIPMNVLYVFLFIYAVIAFQINKVIAPLHEKLSKIVEEIDTLSGIIASIEKEQFASPFSLRLQQRYSGTSYASAKIIRLKKILDRLDIRYNIVLSAPLNLLLLWNLNQALDLEKWKKEYADDVESWFLTLGHFEALISMATIQFNNPDWCVPQLHDKHFFIDATSLGHPLINKDKRVNNFIEISSAGELMLVTGSNMAGKSTYLRSIGVNVVLAMAGGAVCATSFRLSPVQLITSMRIADNLEESTSTFYAELKKLRTVIESVNRGEQVFILLDEILRGTNSLDRHTGSEALIKQLLRKNASGVIATHDLALAELQHQFPGKIMNFHFDVQVNNEELYFDYKLKPGICTSLNASILMKKIGIELE